MKVVWTRTARRHLASIHDYIAEDSPTYARVVVDRLTARSKQIALFPLSGRTLAEYQAPDIREVIETPYRIIYRVLPEQVDVLAVIHSAREWPRRR
mgnify:CR=1 FL=1